MIYCPHRSANKRIRECKYLPALCTDYSFTTIDHLILQVTFWGKHKQENKIAFKINVCEIVNTCHLRQQNTELSKLTSRQTKN